MGKNGVGNTVEIVEPQVAAEIPHELLKEVDPAPFAQSVVDLPKASEKRQPFASLLLTVSSVADTILPWGTDVMARDRQLRSFVASEPVLSSATYSVVIRNASFSWKIVSRDPKKNPSQTIGAVTRMLNNSQNGKGWSSLMVKTWTDLYTQDNGAFWELVRRERRPDSPVIHIRHLDAGQCLRTGDPQTPVIYTDRNGVEKSLAWYDVKVLEEMPSPIETLRDSQMCAVSRVLKTSQIVRDILTYKHEKVSGRNPRAIDFVSGVTQGEIMEALEFANKQATNEGFLRFPRFHIVAGVDPTNPVETKRIDLASLPDNFSFEEEMKWYIAILALGFGVDYQELAPLTGGALGSGQQSEILHLKTRGKGPAVGMAIITHAMNDTGILPGNVMMEYDFQDVQANEQKAQAAFVRAKTRSILLDSGELDPQASRKLAVIDGDLPEWLAQEMDSRRVEAPVEPGVPEPQRPEPNPPGAEQVKGGEKAHREVAKDAGGMKQLREDLTAVEIEDDEIQKEKKRMARRLLED